MCDINSHYNKKNTSFRVRNCSTNFNLIFNSRWVNVLFASSVAADSLTFQNRNFVLPSSEIQEITHRVGSCISTVGGRWLDLIWIFFYSMLKKVRWSEVIVAFKIVCNSGNLPFSLFCVSQAIE